ncbi:hypothetical protein RI367_008100 [Sorochytrium milnesiophthora]
MSNAGARYLPVTTKDHDQQLLTRRRSHFAVAHAAAMDATASASNLLAPLTKRYGRYHYKAVVLLTAITVALMLYTLTLQPPPPQPHPLHIVVPPQAPDFRFAERARGNMGLFPDLHWPKQPAIMPRKVGLLAVPVGAHSKKMASTLALFYKSGFDVMLFHFDNSDWSDVPGYEKYTSVRVLRQTKFWFAKRFLSPSVVENYDYIFLWDDDVGLPDGWDPAQFADILKRYNIHFAQPALLSGLRDNLQYPLVRHHNGTRIGRFTNFVEVMFPIFSSAAWACAWRVTPYDGYSYWGVDNAWYPTCSRIGFCRFAVIDAMPVHHLDQRTLIQNVDGNLREMGYYGGLLHEACHRPVDVNGENDIMYIDQTLRNRHMDSLKLVTLDPKNSFPSLRLSADDAANAQGASKPKPDDGENGASSPADAAAAAAQDLHHSPAHAHVHHVRKWRRTNISRAVCDYLGSHHFGLTFYNVRNVTELDAHHDMCPEKQIWRGVRNQDWWGNGQPPLSSSTHP